MFVFAKSEEEKSPWVLIPADRDAVAKSVKGGAMFITWTKFSHAPESGADEPTRYGDLVLDFDCKDDPAAALQDVRMLCLQHLPEQYGIDAQAIRFYVSGSKGYHAIVPERFFGHPEGHPRLPLIYKRLLQRILTTLPLPTLDMSLFCMGKGKMFRLANIRRRNGRYKVPITVHELMTLDAPQLADLTVEPRQIDPVDVDIEANADMKALWEQAAEEVDDLEAAKSEPLTKAQLAQISSEPPSCITYILLNQPPKSEAFNFNRAVMLLVNYYQDIGATLEQALSNCREFIENYRSTDSYSTPQLRLQHFQKQWAYMLEQIGYFFSCGRARGLKLPHEAYQCLKCIDGPVAEGVETVAASSEPAASLPAETQFDFPWDVMLGHASFFADAFGSVMEVPHHFLFIGYLTCLGAYFAPRVRIDSELNTSPRLFTVFVGESADDRKSTGIKKCVEVFKIAYPGFRVADGMNSAEGLQRVLSEKEEHPFAQHGVVLMVFDEFRTFVSKCSLESSVLLPLVNSLFENHSCESNTKTTTIRVEKAFLSLLSATTRDVYDRVYTPAFIHIGFPNRVFLVPGHATRKFSIPQPVDQKDREFIHNGLIRIKAFVGDGITISITREAKEVYDEYYFSSKPSVHSKRLDTISLRLMQLLALNQEKRVIDEEIATHAIMLVDWQLRVRKLYDPIDADSAISRMEQNIVRHLSHGPMKDGKLKLMVNAYSAGLSLFDRGIENLKRHGLVTYDRKDKQWFGVNHSETKFC